MFEIAKQAMSKTHLRFETLLEGKEKISIDLITEFNNMTARIMLMCALGEDVTELKVDFWEGGKKRQEALADAMRLTFS